MQKQLNQLIAWHKAFEVPYMLEFSNDEENEERGKVHVFRYKLMHEEIKEWMHSALNYEPIEPRAKELADILYTVFGTIIHEGLQDQIEQVFDAVHASNMSKLGADGKPVKRADGKVLKGPNYQEPDLGFLNK